MALEVLRYQPQRPVQPCRRRLTIFFSAGEPSGDLHGANLIRQLRAQHGQFDAVGFGGPRMAEAGCSLHADMTRLAVMWIVRSIMNLNNYRILACHADHYFRRHRPDAVVLIDYPGFNWWMAKRAKAHGIPVFYYAPPQIWGWARWRVKKMRRYVDHVLCCLPFEQTWFAENGCNATFVGHPFFDEVKAQNLDREFMESLSSDPSPLVVILPGSRTQEVEHNLHGFLRAADQIREAVPNVRFAIAAFKPTQAQFARRAVHRTDLPIDVHLGRTPELIRMAHCCMAVSGSVSLELLCHGKPTVIQYEVSRLGYWVQGLLRKVKYITLVNLLAVDDPFTKNAWLSAATPSEADEVLFPEYLTCVDCSESVAGHVIEWLTDPEAYAALAQRLKTLRDEVGHGGAAASAAQYLLAALGRRRAAYPYPGCLPSLAGRASDVETVA